MHRLPDYLNEDEINKIIDAAQHNHKHWLLLKTLYETGVRAEELCNMKIENIMPGTKDFPPQVHIVMGKGKKDRFVPISKDLYNLLMVYIGRRKKGYIFTNNKGERLSTTSVRLIVYKYSKKAGIDRIRVHPHTFRHSRAVYLLKHGMPINELKEFLGHSMLETTAIYLKILPKEMLERYKNIVDGEDNNG